MRAHIRLLSGFTLKNFLQICHDNPAIIHTPSPPHTMLHTLTLPHPSSLILTPHTHTCILTPSPSTLILTPHTSHPRPHSHPHPHTSPSSSHTLTQPHTPTMQDILPYNITDGTQRRDPQSLGREKKTLVKFVECSPTIVWSPTLEYTYSPALVWSNTSEGGLDFSRRWLHTENQFTVWNSELGLLSHWYPGASVSR